MNKLIYFFLLLFVVTGFSQGRKVETDTLKARMAFKIKISDTWYDRSSFFGYLDGSNKLIGTSGIQAASVSNTEITDPWVGITAGNGLWGTSGTANLGQVITLQVNVDGETITISNDTLSATGTLDSAGVRQIVSDSISQFLDSITVKMRISDSLDAYFPVTNANLQNSSINISANDGLSGGGIINLGESAILSVNVDSPLVIINDTLNIADSSITWTKLDTAVMDSIRAGGSGLDSAEIRNKFFPITDPDIDSLYSGNKVKGSAIELNPNSILGDSAGLKVYYDINYLAVNGVEGITDRWHSKNGGIDRDAGEWYQILSNDTIYYPVPQCIASGYLDAWGASGGETLFIFNKAGEFQNFILTTDSTRYTINTISFAANDSFYISTSGTIYLDNVYLVTPKQLTLADSGITGDKIGSGEIEYLHFDAAAKDSISGWNIQISDTNELKAYDGPLMAVYLEKLNTNILGGGYFFKDDSAAMRLIWGAGIVADGISYESNVAGKRWFRQAMLEQMILRPEWFGAVMDGTTDDAPAISATISHHFATGFEIYLGEGTYQLNSSLNITNPASTSGNKAGIRMIGKAGANTTTTFSFASGVSPCFSLDGSTIAGARVYSTYIENLNIVSDGSKTDTCFYIRHATTGFFRNVSMSSFRLGIDFIDSDNFVFQQTQGAGIYGIHIRGNSNGNTFLECAFTGNDSVGVRLSSSNGNVFEGGDRGNQPISFEGITTCSFTITSGNFESHDSAAIILNDNSTATVYHSRFLKGTGDGIVARLNNTTHIKLFDAIATGHSATDSIIILANTTCTAPWFGIPENVNYYIWNQANNEKYIATNLYTSRVTTGLDYGKLYFKQNGVNSTTTADNLIMNGRVLGTVHQFRLFETPQFRYDLNLDPALPVRKNRTRKVEGYKLFISIAGDSTPVTVVFNNKKNTEDILFINTPLLWKRTGNKKIDMYATIDAGSNDPVTSVADSVTFLVWHKDNPKLGYDQTAGGLELGLFYQTTFIDSTSWGD